MESTGETETLDCGLVLRSIGYKSIQADSGIPFDAKRGIVPNENGRTELEGLYCAGWVATGPRGVIVDTMTEAHRVADTILGDIGHQKDKIGREGLEQMLRERSCDFVDWEGWRKIDSEEIKRGESRGKPREKITSVETMLDIAKK